MKLDFTNDSFYQAQANRIPCQKKISSWKKNNNNNSYFVINSAGQSSQHIILSAFLTQMIENMLWLPQQE